MVAVREEQAVLRLEDDDRRHPVDGAPILLDAARVEMTLVVRQACNEFRDAQLRHDLRSWNGIARGGAPHAWRRCGVRFSAAPS